MLYDPLMHVRKGWRAMATNVPLWTYHLYQCLLPPLAPEHMPETLWERNNGRTYRYMADISATSASCAAAYALGQKIPKAKGEARFGASVARSGARRIARTGDVLVGDESAWMITTPGEVTKISYVWPSPLTTYDMSDPVYEVAWSPDGEQVAGVGNRKVFVRSLQCDSRRSYEYHRRGATSLCWDPQGRRIASADSNGDVHFWSVAPAQPHLFDASHGRILIARPPIEVATNDAMRCVRWSPNKNMVAAGSACGSVFLLNPDTGEEYFAYRGHRMAVQTLAWSPDGRTLASGGEDTQVQVWQVKEDATPEVVYQEHQGAVQALAWSPEGQRIASVEAHAASVQVWRPQTGTAVTRIPLSVSYARSNPDGTSLSWSPDGCLLAVGCADGTIQILDVASSSHIWTYRTSRNQRVATVSWSPDGMVVAAGGDDLRISLWAWDHSCVQVQRHLLEQGVVLF